MKRLTNNNLAILVCLFSSILAACTEATPTTTSTPDITKTVAEAARLTIEAERETPADSGITPTVIYATLPPPLSDIKFPTENIEYPQDWPVELILPAEFMLVEIVSGLLPGDQATAWGAKYRIDNDPDNTRTILDTYFQESGWEIVETNEFESKGLQFLIKRQAFQGVITIDTDRDNPQQSIILMMIFE